MCTCPAGLIQSGTNCYACQPQSTYSPDTKKCQCIQGYYASDPFTCTLIPSCFPGAVFDVNLKFCKCTNPAFVLTHIGCTCPSGMQNTVDNKCFCSLTAPFDNNNCLCVPGAQYSLTSQSCIPPITGTSVAIYGSSCTVNQLLLGMCVSLFPDKTDPTTCTCTISLKILMLTPGFNPTVKVNPVDTFPGCFILQLTAPSISKKTFTFQTIVKQDPTGTTTTGGTTTTTTTSNT